MKKKKIIALCLAAALAIGNVIPTMAAEPNVTETKQAVGLKMEKEKRIPLERIELDGNGYHMYVGESDYFYVYYYPDNTTDDRKITWSSSNSNVVKIDQTGTFTAVGTGSCVITARGANNTKATCTIDVDAQDPWESIKLDQTNVTVGEGKSVTVNAYFMPSKEQLIYVDLHSSDESVATVEQDYKGDVVITGHKEGTATITVSYPQVKAATCKVTVTKYVGTPKLKSAANKQDGIQVTWNASKNAKNYNVYRKLPKDKSWTYLDTIKETSYFDKYVKNNETYIYTVKAKNGDAKSGYDKKGIQIVRLTTPVLNKAENVLGGSKVTWKKVPGATTYNVYRKANDEKKWTTVAKNIKGTRYVDKKVENNNSYLYTVRAVKNGQLSYYDTKGIRVTYLTAPKLSVKNTPGGATMSWKAIPGATGYKVYHKAKGDKKWTVLEQNFQGTSYKDTKVVNGKEYTYAVRALKDQERSYYKGVTLVHVSTPTLKEATIVKGGIKVRWEEVEGATSYRVYRKAKGEKSWKMIAKTVKGLSYTDKNVKDKETYTYTVKAFKGNAYSGNSSQGVSCTYEK